MRGDAGCQISFDRADWKEPAVPPLVLYTAAVVLAEVVSALAAKKADRPEWYLGHEKLFIYLGLGIILVNWIVKNYFLVVKGIDLLPMPI